MSTYIPVPSQRPRPFGPVLLDADQPGPVRVTVVEWGPQAPTVEPVIATVQVDLAGEPDRVVLLVDGVTHQRIDHPDDAVQLFSRPLNAGSHRLTVYAERENSSDTTGRPRVVTVTAALPPDPQPVPGVVTTFIGAHGLRIRVHPDGSVDAGGEADGPWEQLEVAE